MIKSNVLFLMIIFLLFTTIYLSNNEYVRCSTLGDKLFDDILGLEFGNQKCREFVKKNEKTETNNTNAHIYPKENRYSILEAKKEKVCPSNSDVIVVLGQSNSANHLIYDDYKKNDHLNYFNGNCYSLTDPVLGATGENQSIVPALSSKILSNKPIIFLTNGWSATSITEWSREDSELTSYANKNILEIAKKNNLKYIIWIQGESDRHKNIDYKDHFLKFKKLLLKNLTKEKKEHIKFIITQTSICRDIRDIKLNKHQKNLGKMKNFYTTEVTDNLDINYRYDGCHFNKFGVELITEEISKIINSNLDIKL